MGAEQSTVLGDGPSGSSFGDSPVFDSSGPTSLPTSPKKEAFGSQHALKAGRRSLSVLAGSKPRHSFSSLSTDLLSNTWREPPSSSLNRVSSTSASALNTRSTTIRSARSVTMDTETGKGIVVVCPGPCRSLRAAGSLDFGSRSSKVDQAAVELRKLRQIPPFTPLLSKASISPSDYPSTEKQSQVYLKDMDSSKLLSLVMNFGKRVNDKADTVYQTQVQLIGLQNKIDYEVQRLAEDLKAREQGVPSNSLKRSKQIDSMQSTHSTELSLAGRKQVDAVVLLTSQISGLIDQCSTMTEQVHSSLQQLNASLPLSKQLPPLDICISKHI